MLAYALQCLIPLACLANAPHIVLIVVDDVGHADFSYMDAQSPREHQQTHPIPTPNIDNLSKQGIRLTQHYASPTCTPTRAALLTGRYAANTGLNLAMVPGSLAGLPPSLPTLPELLGKRGYECHMVGKWHLGHARWSQTPVGRGFKSHLGSLMWDLDSYTKQMYREPWSPMAVDWIRTWENRSFVHFLEPRHATIALTDEAQKVIQAHPSSAPLFLYLAYTAAHSPLQPEPSHVAKCRDIPNDGRRKFCGMVVGLDEAIKNVTDTARSSLGDNLVVVVTSDNGGSTWFGGSNQPLRSGKTTPFEGGVRVPAFAVDYSPGGKYFGAGNRTYDGMLHVSDWLPTFLALSGAPAGLETDGFDLGPSLRSHGPSPRSEVLLDMYYANETVFTDEWVVGIRQGSFKLIEGFVRDPHWYRESTSDYLNSTDSSWVTPLFQHIIWAVERMFGEGPSDSARVALTHRQAHDLLSTEVRLLFDLSVDPRETVNLHSTRPDIVSALRKRAEELRGKRPPQAKAWFQVPADTWRQTMVPGECGKVIPKEHCRFTHPWVPDAVADEQVPTVDANVFLKTVRTRLLLLLGIPAVILNLLFYACWREKQRRGAAVVARREVKKTQ